jgi:4-hydroxybenzoate polyprenyltransferase
MTMKRGTLVSILMALMLILVALVDFRWASLLAVIYLFAFTIYRFAKRKRKQT